MEFALFLLNVVFSALNRKESILSGGFTRKTAFAGVCNAKQPCF
jgi:hypothetical protein